MTASLPIDLHGLPIGGSRRDLRIGPLSVGAMHHLLKERFGRTPSRATVVRVHETSGGNPLFALEIRRLLEDIGEPPADQPLPVPGDIKALVGRRVRRLPDPSRDVLLAAAAHGHARTTLIERALGRPIGGDLRVAELADIVRLEGDAVMFAHPLFADAIYSGATEAQRRAMHLRLAEAADGAEERARHRALAASGPDAAVASQLVEAARIAAARGAPSAAAELMESALRLTPSGSGDAWDERSIVLAEFHQRAGSMERAQDVLDRVIVSSASPRTRARAQLALGAIEYEADIGSRASPLAEAAMTDAEGDPALLAHAHALLALVEYTDRRAALRHAHEAKRLIDGVADADPKLESLVLNAYVATEFDAGHPLPMAIVERGLALERIAPRPNVADRLSAALGAWLKYEDIASARRWLEATYRSAVEEGDEGSMPYALSHLPTLELAAGNWSRAEAVARQHLTVAGGLGLFSRDIGYNEEPITG